MSEDQDQDKYMWAMAIDLDLCTGCQACVVACHAENNVPSVGLVETIRNRAMHWIWIERYWQEHPDQVTATFRVMLCQHCETAPCEPVCPVYATYHDTNDGLNIQVYNRCMGIRYCGINCPYKVRYFNWFDPYFPEPLNEQLNPDVTVRRRGVMEKCSFCVHRIREVQNRARIEGQRAIVDGEVVPACQQSCPAEAIVFGDIRDPHSRVAQVSQNGRGYRVLDALINTQPAVTYLKKVTLYWNSGSYTWDDLNIPTFEASYNIGAYTEETPLEIYSVAEDTSGNRFESDHKTILVTDLDSVGPEISNVSVLEHGGNGNGVIESDESIVFSWQAADVNGVTRCSLFIDDVECDVGKVPLGEIAHGELHRGRLRLAGECDLVVRSVLLLDAVHYRHRVVEEGLPDFDLLEAADQRLVLLEVFRVFLLGRRAD